jgi:hypothetical protein
MLGAHVACGCPERPDRRTVTINSGSDVGPTRSAHPTGLANTRLPDHGGICTGRIFGVVCAASRSERRSLHPRSGLEAVMADGRARANG